MRKLVLLVALALGAAACGGGSEPAAESPAVSAAPAGGEDSMASEQDTDPGSSTEDGPQAESGSEEQPGATGSESEPVDDPPPGTIVRWAAGSGFRTSAL